MDTITHPLVSNIGESLQSVADQRDFKLSYLFLSQVVTRMGDCVVVSNIWRRRRCCDSEIGVGVVWCASFTFV
jgi:hypothetical protein